MSEIVDIKTALKRFKNSDWCIKQNDYLNVSKPIDITCKKCGFIWKNIRPSYIFNYNRICPKCDLNKRPIRLTIEDYINSGKDKGFKLISKEIPKEKAYYQYITWMCLKCKKITKLNIHLVKHKKLKYCKDCNKKNDLIIMKNRIKKLVSSKNAKIPKSYKYINSKQPIPITLKCGHKWNPHWNYLQHGYWLCPICNKIKSDNNYKNYAKNHDWKVINITRKKILLNLKCGHAYDVWKDNIKRIKKINCRKCEMQKFEKKIYQIVKRRGGKILSKWKGFKSGKTPIPIQCNCGRIWNSNWFTLNNDHWCPNCFSGKNEKECCKIMEEYFKVSFPRIRPKWLNGLELDGYNEKLKIAFEYQGEYHYKNAHFYNNKKAEIHLVKIKNRDKRKKEICKKLGIKLIIIPYYIKSKDRKNYIIKIFKKLNRKGIKCQSSQL